MHIPDYTAFLSGKNPLADFHMCTSTCQSFVCSCCATEWFQKQGLVETGCAKVIYHALEKLTHQKEARYVIPLYYCIAKLLETTEMWNRNKNLYEVNFDR